jgi:hypothetical protein
MWNYIFFNESDIAVQVAQSENYEVKGKKTIAPRSQISFTVRCTKSTECHSIEKEILQVVVCDVQTKKVNSHLC